MSSAGNGFLDKGDQAVDVRRYIDALRRSAWEIAVVAAIVTVVVVGISKSLTKTYSASARLIYNPSSSVLSAADAESTVRQLATYESLVRSPPVMAAASKRLGESPAAVKSSVSASVESSANILVIKAASSSPPLAAARANGVAQSFIAEEQALQNSGYQSARSQLEAEITQLKASPNTGAQVAALESRISALQISATGTDSELQIAEAATIPTSPTSPKVTLNAVIALVVSLLLGVLIVLARDQLRPRFASPREIGDALGLPVLSGIPYRTRSSTARRRRALTGLESEAINLLRTSVRLLGLPDQGPRVIMVTSATHGEGKTTITANLGRSLARSGQRTLLISGDMRAPALHGQFEVPLSPGLSDCLQAAQRNVSYGEMLESSIRAAPGEQRLDILAAGEMPEDPSALAWSPALHALIEATRAMDYSYVLIDAPPMLGIADAQLLSREADDVLMVARLDRVSPYQAEELRGLMTRLEIKPVGLTVLGARAELSPYYYVEEGVPAG
jgi:capsular exopolysaccharide synthesis family protein